MLEAGDVEFLERLVFSPICYSTFLSFE